MAENEIVTLTNGSETVIVDKGSDTEAQYRSKGFGTEGDVKPKAKTKARAKAKAKAKVGKD
jgi:hypothetical protein